MFDKKIQDKSKNKDHFTKLDKKHLENLYSWINNLDLGQTILDLNCNDGYGLNIISNKFSHIDGVDTDPDEIKFAFRNFFIYHKTRFFVSKPLDFLHSCTNYDVTVYFDIQNHEDMDFNIFLDKIPSPIAILSFSGDSEFINKCESIIKKKKITYEWFYEHEDEIDKIQNESVSHILMLKNIRNTMLLKNELPLVSIVIPAYNSESTLEETLLSATNQSYSNLEILVIDDGSTDRTKEICDRFRSKIKYYYKPNGGIASAINLGIKKMSGQWFKWLSSDDVLTKNAVESLLMIATSTGGQIIYSDYDKIDEKGKFISTFTEQPYYDYYQFASKLWMGYIGNASGSLIHKSCFEIVGFFDENLRFGEDYNWWLRACLVHGYRFFHLEKPIVKYRVHVKQMTAKVKNKNYENDQMIRKHIKKLILTSDPIWWTTLSHYRKIYNKIGFKKNIKRKLRLMLHRMPYDIENKVITWKNRTFLGIESK